jgi:xylulokinase
MGIDIGTSGAKAIIMADDGTVASSAFQGYGLEHPEKGCAEQHPLTWWRACVNVISQVLDKSHIADGEIAAVGLSGQMHSIVILDKNNEVIRPAVIWCDQRSKAQVDLLYEKIPKERFGEITLNPAFPGCTIASLMWIKEHEPENYARISTVMPPKDYIRLKLTCERGTDITDASGTMCFDPVGLTWSDEILCAAGMEKGIFPTVGKPYDTAGEVTEQAARETGLKKGTPVVFGGGDQPMQALGNGIVECGTASSTIGTGGQIYTPAKAPLYDKKLRTHTFCSALEGQWGIVGGTLSAGLSLKWLRENILGGIPFAELDAGAQKITPGCGGLIFLPYLSGERTPHMDSDARGVFFGLNLAHDSASLARAVMEGVAFSLRDSFGVFEELGISVDRVIASGGGARSRLWKKIQADVFGREIYTVKNSEQACTGAAVMAGVGCGIYAEEKQACDAVISFEEETIEPVMDNVKKYEEVYNVYKKLYSSNKDLFKEIKAL